jgi:hypothetical protein
MIDWTKVEDGLPEREQPGIMQVYSFLTDRFKFRPIFFIGLIEDRNCFDKYRSYFGHYNHDLKIWQTMEGQHIRGVTHWTEYNEPADL